MGYLVNHLVVACNIRRLTWIQCIFVIIIDIFIIITSVIIIIIDLQ